MTYDTPKAVIYARYSSHNQREESIEGQLRVCHDYALSHGIDVIAEYIDRAQSATTDRRDSFQRLIRDSQKERFSLVLVYNLDRFSRNRYDSAVYKAKLRKHGVQIRSVTQAIPDGPDGIILESVMEGINEYYSANLARNVKRGMHENALAAKVNGKMPYGYRKGDDGRYAISGHEAAAVRLIFQRYADGCPKTHIVKELNQKGYRTSYGKPFRVSSLEEMLKNRRYTGVYIYGEIETPGAIPVIIEQELFDRVQVMIEKKRRAKGHMKATSEYILTGKLYCGRCDTPMVGESGKSRNGEVYRYYKCGKAKRTAGACDKRPVRKEKLEDLVVHTLADQVLTDENISIISARIWSIYQTELADHSHADALRTQLAETETKLANVLKAIEMGIFTTSTKERLESLEAERADLEDAIAVEEGRKSLLSQEMIESYLIGLRTGVEKSDDYRRALIQTFADRIYLFDDKVVITFRLSSDGEPQTVTANGSDIVGSAQPLPIDPNTWLIFDGRRVAVIIKLPD